MIESDWDKLCDHTDELVATGRYPGRYEAMKEAQRHNPTYGLLLYISEMPAVSPALPFGKFTIGTFNITLPLALFIVSISEAVYDPVGTMPIQAEGVHASPSIPLEPE